MKILLIVPTHGYTKGYPHFLSVSDFPQGLAYLAAALKHAGHEVIGLNLNNITGYTSAHAMISNRISQALTESNPDLIGMGGICTDYAFLKDAMQIIRHFSKSPVVLGGGIVNNDPEWIMNDLKPDYAIVGEAEEAIVNLLDWMPKRETTPPPFNLWYWIDGKATFSISDYNYGKLDDRAFPDYEPFNIGDMLDNYSQATRVLYRYTRTHPRTWAITTARSCPFNCSFCVHSHGATYRARSIENIMAEIKVMYERYKFNVLIIGDELFAANKKRMQDFCNAILENKEKYGWDFDWMFQTHANARLDLETLELAKRAGCYLFSYGLESASPLILKSMNKKSNIGQIIEAINLSRKVGIGFSGNILFGDPVETEYTILESLDFYARYCKSSMVFLSFLMPYPGSKVFDYCVAKGLITDKKYYYEHIDGGIYNMTNMPDADWQHWVSFIHGLSTNWLYTAHTEAEEWHREAGNYFHVSARCPHCAGEVEYRNELPLNGHVPERLFLGPGCTRCNQVMRIDLTGRRFVHANTN